MPLSPGSGVEWGHISSQRAVMIHFVAVLVANTMWSYCFAEVLSFYSFLGRQKCSAAAGKGEVLTFGMTL